MVDDTISRQAAIKAIFREPAWHGSNGSYYHEVDIRSAINALPSAQPEIVRCKDCKYYIKSESYCDYLGITISDLDFCSFAERKE